MSIRVSAAVWALSDQKGTGLVMMLAIADMARDDGVAWPGITYIATKSRVSRRQAMRVLADLKASGELEVVRQGGGNRANMYRINLPLLYSREARDFSDPGAFEETDDTDVTGGILSEVTPGAWGVTVTAANVPPMSPETSEEPLQETSTALAADAAGDGEHLPGLEPPAPPPVPEDENIAAVWDHYAARFGDRLSKKELTEPRRKTIKKGLAAVNGDVALCKRAIDGLKSYRQSRSSGSTDISLSVIFSTGPHDRSNLTEKIEWWAAQSEGKAEVPTSVPSGHRGRVMDLATQALKVEHQPDNDAVRERGEQAQAILGERFGLKIISDGNGKLLRFEQVGE